MAILPFQNLSDKPDVDHIVYGFVEDLITDLSRFGLKVISNHSTQTIKPENEKDALDRLDVDYYVKGSFRFYGDQVRISIQLIKSEDESVVFAGKHDESFDSLMSLQNDITQQIVNVLQKQIDFHIVSSSHKSTPTKLAAYDYWLRGVAELRKGTRTNDETARKLFNQSLAIDPNYARAHTGLSLSYFNEWSCQMWSRWDVSKNGAHKHAVDAVQVDENEYLAQTVLGRTFLYDGEYDKAENCLRKSLQLNPNDSDNLIEVASCFVYLGYPEEAKELYLKANRLNPFRQNWYYATGSLIYFELGEFEKALEIGNLLNLEASWVDFPAVQAAIEFSLGNHEKALEKWQVYLRLFAKKISNSNEIDEVAALDWFKNINPYKSKPRSAEFWKFIESKWTGESKDEAPKNTHSSASNELYKEQDFWKITYQGMTISIKDMKGLHDIQKLLTDPGKSYHCTDLMGSAIEEVSSIAQIDQQAKKSYEAKLTALQQELKEAEDMNDLERASQISEEYENLLEHVSKSLGLAGKSRKANSSLEKTRSAVTWRIRSTIKKIEEHHPQLGLHLTQSIKTGILCSYTPEFPTSWNT